VKNLTLLLLALTFAACKKSTSTPAPVVTAPTVAEKIKKSWSANQVTEAGTVVYAKAGSNNTKPAYSKFKLDLSNAASAILTEFDGNSFTGTWEVVSDKTLIMKGLSPLPSNSNGTIEYSISEASTTVLKLSRTTESAKTGGASVAYVLE
jgi:hypothetical protein